MELNQMFLREVLPFGLVLLLAIRDNSMRSEIPIFIDFVALTSGNSGDITFNYWRIEKLFLKNNFDEFDSLIILLC
jgi:hypothetical protein